MKPVVVAGQVVKPGKRVRFDAPIARLPTQVMASVPLEVLHGRKEGPTIWLSAAVHGDELNGVEVIRRVLLSLQPKELCGTVIAVPIVNIFGFMQESRYLPDRRDLNRCFPGSARGSLAGRLAHFLMTEVVDQCSVGLDLHTAARDNTNLPQVRADLRDPETAALAEAFGAQVSLHSRVRDGSLREAAVRRGAKVLMYEAGEALRFDATAIADGVSGVLRVMNHLGMINVPASTSRRPIACESSKWIRAGASGLAKIDVALGQEVGAGEPLGVITDAFGGSPKKLKASRAGVVVGLAQNPVVHRGDALVHIAHPGIVTQVEPTG